jgi:hypothetical protein
MNLKEITDIAWKEFSADFPNLAADIEMYRAGSIAVTSLDTIVARRAWSVFERAYVAGAAAEQDRILRRVHCIRQDRGMYVDWG